MSTPDTDHLTGWKEIGEYLRRSPRSAQRWEREMGLPVKRAKTAHGQVVYASRAELDAWMARFNGHPPEEPESREASSGASTIDSEDTPQSQARRTPSAWVIAVLVCLVAFVGLIAARFLPGFWRPEVLTNVVVFGRVAEGRDAGGRTLWTHQFDQDVMSVPLAAPLAPSVDIDGDGTDEFLVPVRFGTGVHDLRRTDALYVFTAGGTVRWSATLPASQALVCGGETIGGPWQLSAVAVSTGGGPKRVWAAFNHHTKRPSMLFEIQPDGRQTMRYVQAGWIMGVTEWRTPGGALPLLAVAGVINERARASLVTFDPTQDLTMVPGGDYQCDVRQAMPPSRVILFPPQDVIAAYGYPYHLASAVAPMADALRVNLSGSQASAWVEADGTVSEITFTDDYRLTHDDLFRRGSLTHSIDECPTLLGTHEIETWTVAGGWQRYVLPAKTGRTQ